MGAVEPALQELVDAPQRRVLEMIDALDPRERNMMERTALPVLVETAQVHCPAPVGCGANIRCHRLDLALRLALPGHDVVRYRQVAEQLADRRLPALLGLLNENGEPGPFTVLACGRNRFIVQPEALLGFPGGVGLFLFDGSLARRRLLSGPAPHQR